MMNKLLQASIDRYKAEISEALATLDIYFNNPVGIGEHPDLLTEIDKYIEKLDSATSKLETLHKYFVENDEKVEVKAKVKKLLKG
jgi:hypothetical protein|tara:strand:+ start:260 stop:514 length:255 start_codon:yes stop_codon:yes gene_type:complete